MPACAAVRIGDSTDRAVAKYGSPYRDLPPAARDGPAEHGRALRQVADEETGDRFQVRVEADDALDALDDPDVYERV